MDIKDFEQAAIKIIGTTFGWQSKIARLLKVDARTVRRWVQQGETPSWVIYKLNSITRISDICPYPRDEWVIGGNHNISSDKKPRQYIYHAQYPRFIARIASVYEDDYRGFVPLKSEMPCDLETGTVYRCDTETILCEISWIDTIDFSEAAQWLKMACDMIEKNSN